LRDVAFDYAFVLDQLDRKASPLDRKASPLDRKS
jgi:hypothetical protein